jgi:DNA-binding NtrC family response regulator
VDPSRFDLVITDQTMPEMTGVELAKKVLTLRADMPIIMCTGFSHVVDAEEGEKRRMNKANRGCKPQRRRDDARAIGRLFA